MPPTTSSCLAGSNKTDNACSQHGVELPIAAAAAGARLVAAVRRVNTEVLDSAVGGGVAAAGGVNSTAALQQAQEGLSAAQDELAAAVTALRRRVEEGSGAQLPLPKPGGATPVAAIAHGGQDGQERGEMTRGDGGDMQGGNSNSGDAAAVLEVLRAFIDKRLLGRGNGGASGGAASSCSSGESDDRSSVTAPGCVTDLNLAAVVVAAAAALEQMQQASEDCPQQRWLLLRQTGADANSLAITGASSGASDAGVSSEAVGGSGAAGAPPPAQVSGYRLVLSPLQPGSPEAPASAVAPLRPHTAQRPSATPRQCMAFVPRVEHRAVLGHMEVVRAHVCSFQPRFRVHVPELSPAPAGEAGAGAAAGAQGGNGRESGVCFVVCGGHVGHFKGYEHMVEPLE
ncbi:hypothetical protein HXX76_005606 [Chlamydomonas incerta]|uniref:Uncharacterized protein n=1 Tax=Chlamydomonas incerta TaxID=51695 RepID=A0A835T2Y5_CHLIN|nr:hypothetical protein HXX76_005606 [Chlamydomonas incerta]|eukprot:KAG2437992.1 hypothetical protein HXX76_005606 [Chlamydomonas incerta]